MANVEGLLTAAGSVWERSDLLFLIRDDKGARIGHVGLTDISEDGAVYVDLIEIEPRCQGVGHGSAALDQICRIADDHGVRLFLSASSSGRINDRGLVAWYERRGFVETEPFPDMEGVSMERPPREPIPEP